MLLLGFYIKFLYFSANQMQLSEFQYTTYTTNVV